MSRHPTRIAPLVSPGGPGQHDPRYRGFFDCFNRGEYFEAHDVLEALWLPVRQGAEGRFYKGLIQLAGAFVHWQKRRPGPMAALLRLADANLRDYEPVMQGLEVAPVRRIIADWLDWLTVLPAGSNTPRPAPSIPRLVLEASAEPAGERPGTPSL